MSKPNSSMWTRLALLGLMGACAWVQVIWIQSDGGIGDGVCCGFTPTVLDILRADGTGQLGWPWSEYRRSMGLLVWPALAARKLVGPDPDFLLWLTLACLLLTQMFLFLIGRRLGGNFAGVIAAGIWPMIPAVAFMSRRWDAMVPQHLVLVFACWCLLHSERFRVPIPTMGFVLAAMIGSILSARETDNLLFMAAVGSLAVGAALGGILTGRSTTGDVRPRWKSALGATVIAGVMGVFMVQYAFPLVDFGYFADEMGNRSYEAGAQRLSLEALTAYPLRLYSDDLTPWITWPFLIALVVVLRRSTARWELLCWIALPLLALGLVGKKNYYYAAVIYPAIPLVLGIGFARFKPPIIGVLLGVGTLVLGWAQYSGRSLPTSTYPQSLATVNWNGSVGPQQHLFQGIVPLNLAPRGPSAHNDAIELAKPRFETPSCDCPQHLMFMGSGDPSDLNLSLAMTDPCLNLSRWPQMDHPDSVGWIMITSDGCVEKPPTAFLANGFELVGARGEAERCSSLWGRSQPHPPRLCGHRGSPPGPQGAGALQNRVHPDLRTTQPALKW